MFQYLVHYIYECYIFLLKFSPYKYVVTTFISFDHSLFEVHIVYKENSSTYIFLGSDCMEYNFQSFEF